MDLESEDGEKEGHQSLWAHLNISEFPILTPLPSQKEMIIPSEGWHFLAEEAPVFRCFP